MFIRACWLVVADAAAEGEFQFERRKFGTTESELRQLAQWLAERNVREAVMESTALYAWALRRRYPESFG
jgi:hypothetical protein